MSVCNGQVGHLSEHKYLCLVSIRTDSPCAMGSVITTPAGETRFRTANEIQPDLSLALLQLLNQWLHVYCCELLITEGTCVLKMH